MTPPAESSLLSTPLVVAYIGLVGTLLAIAINGYLARRSEKRESFAKALATVMEYWEFPYVVRRRRHDDAAAERVRISEAMREVQARLSFHHSWIRLESPKVAKAYGDLVAQTRVVMGSQIRDAWNGPTITTDAAVNINDVKRDGLDDLVDLYLQAVRDHLSLWPTWIRSVGRQIRGA